MKYKNFYENVKEANLRLRNTVVWYDGPGEQGPYHVLIITDHAGDDYKIYMKRLGQPYQSQPNIYPPCDGISNEYPNMGEKMDVFMKANPSFNIIRKDLSSPHFNRFRPFPLGMMNTAKKDKSGRVVSAETVYLERQPNRATHQGLVRPMIYVAPVTAAMARPPAQVHYNFDLWSVDFYECLMGHYPSADDCLSNLSNPDIGNEAAAFNRYFAFVRGPIGMIFLSYKGEVVGVLDNKNMSQISVDREKKYTREAISDLHLFKDIRSR